MNRRLRTLKPTSVQQLQTMIEDIWLGITAKKCQNLVNSMPQCVKQCMLARANN